MPLFRRIPSRTKFGPYPFDSRPARGARKRKLHDTGGFKPDNPLKLGPRKSAKKPTSARRTHRKRK